MTSINSLTLQIDAEGRELQARLIRIDPTTVTVTWTIPTGAKVYYGALVVASPQMLNPSNFPTNEVKYAASASWTNPADKIGLGQVVGAFYNDMTTKAMTITDLPPDAPIYVSVHLVTNVYEYFNPGVRTYPEDGFTIAYAGAVPDSYGPPENPTPGQVYFDPDQGSMFVWNGNAWIHAKEHTCLTGTVDPVPGVTEGLPAGYPAVGHFFYNTITKMLKSWTGTSWRDAETKRGQPMYEEQNVGTTGEPGARDKIKNILKYQLGYPMVCVELVEEHFEIALDNALQELRRRVDSAYYRQYFFMTIFKGQQVYYLNDKTTGVAKVVDIIKIHRLNMLGLVNWGPDNLYAQQFLNQFYAPGVGYDLVSIHLIHSLSELYSQLFAGDIGFNWRESTRELQIYRLFGFQEKVLLETSCEKPEQELFVDRWTQQWIQQWAEAELMMMLANIRGKYASLPGPGGGLQLNASELRAEGQRLQEDCLRQVKDYEVGQNGPDNGYAPFVIG